MIPALSKTPSTFDPSSLSFLASHVKRHPGTTFQGSTYGKNYSIICNTHLTIQSGRDTLVLQFQPFGITLNELPAVIDILYHPQTKWNRILTDFVNKQLSSNDALYTLYGTLYLHPLALYKQPEAVLKKVISNNIARVGFLTDALNEARGTDYGGPSRHLITELAKALFDGTERRSIHFENGLPCINEDANLEEQKELFRNIGKFFSYAHERHMHIGPVLPPAFFTLLKDIETHSSNTSNWTQNHIDAASCILEKLSPQLRALSPETLNRTLQGDPLNADNIISRFVISSGNAIVTEKINHLKTTICKKLEEGNTEWVEKFLFYVTGSRAITAQTQLTFYCGTSYEAHTCFHKLDILGTYDTFPEEIPNPMDRFIFNLELLMDNPNFTTA